MENTSNPLSKFFRQPAVFLKLPSGGRFWSQQSLELPLNEEIPVYPLTTKDEIILRTPDALLNGAGVVEVIQSCCPNIKNAWETPNIDIDAILIAIRIASYGETMEQPSKCPHCKEDNTHEVNLPNLLENIKMPDYSKKFSINGLNIKLKPQKYFNTNKSNSLEFTEAKLRKALEMSDSDSQQRGEEIAKSIERLINISIETVANSTEYIETPDNNIVSDPAHIFEFYQNSDRKLVNAIIEFLASINENAGFDDVTVTCGECSKPYVLPLIFDYSNFFVSGS